MTIHSAVLGSGDGWFAHDVVCDSGPDDRPFEERHGSVCVAAVLRGTFRYRSRTGTAMLAPGAVMLGNVGDCFECGHEHGAGDRCLSFHFTPEYWERLVAAVPGARSAHFAVPRLPPHAALIGATAALDAPGPPLHETLEATALNFAGAVLSLLSGAPARASIPRRTTGLRARERARDEDRVTRIVRHIEATAHEGSEGTLSVGALASLAGLSPFHFLRTFRRLVGMTPYQFVLRTRLHRAAVRLRVTGEEVAAIALEAGFGDLSTFNRRFRRLIGVSPRAYRAGDFAMMPVHTMGARRCPQGPASSST